LSGDGWSGEECAENRLGCDGRAVAGEDMVEKLCVSMALFCLPHKGPEIC